MIFKSNQLPSIFTSTLIVVPYWVPSSFSTLTLYLIRQGGAESGIRNLTNSGDIAKLALQVGLFTIIMFSSIVVMAFYNNFD